MRIPLITTLALILLMGTPAFAESKRVEVYSLTQQYWDVKAGDTLGEIVDALLPANREKQAALMQDIVQLNPDAFINGDPNRVLANRRLWLPNTIQTPVSDNSSSAAGSTTIEHFNWGNVKRVTP